MTNLPEDPSWPAGVYQIEQTDPVLGGPPNLEAGAGIANVQAEQLAKRTAWLKQQIETLSGAVGNQVFEWFARIDAKRDSASYRNAALILGAPRGDTADGATAQGRGLLAVLGKSAGTNAGPVWLASRSSGISADHTDDDIKGYNGFGIRLDEGGMELWRDNVRVMQITFDGNMKLIGQVGMVQAFATSTRPAGWLECNGAAVSRSSYADLFAAIGVTYGSGDGNTTFNLPDYRGEFIRGWDHGRGVDAGRALGSAQDDMLKAHKHTQTGAVGSGGNLANYNVSSATGSTVTDLNNETGLTGGTETRPRNLSAMICIKY